MTTSDRVRRGGIDVSLLIATRQRPDLLAGALRSLAATVTGGPRWELIVIDNAPRTGSEDLVRTSAPTLPLTWLAEPRPGKNRALNVGLTRATGALVAFTDDDVIVEPDWLAQLWSGAERWPKANVFGGRILPRWPDVVSPPAFHPFFEHAYAIADFDHGEGAYSSGYVYGANMAIRRAIFDAGWRFNPERGPDGTDRYIPGSETSLTVALERAGHQCVYLPGALVHHQIRSEQMTPRWLYGRAFRKGRADAIKMGLNGGGRIVPRALIAAAWREYAAWWRSRLRRDSSGALDHGVAYWTARGMIHQCRSHSRPDALARQIDGGARTWGTEG